MITVDVTGDVSRIPEVSKSLRYLTSKDFLVTVPTADFKEQILEYIKSVSPEAGGGLYGKYLTYLGARVNSSRDEFMSFKDSWRIRRETSEETISFVVWNLLETAKGSRANIKFQAVEYGSQTTTWIASRTFRFKSEQRWTTIKQGRPVVHRGSQGAEAQQKTLAFIESVLIPQVRTRVDTIVSSRFK